VSRENVELVRRANTAFNSGDYDGLQALLDPEIEFVDHLPLPDVAQSAHGTDEIRALLDAWREGFAGFEADVKEYVDLGDFVIAVTRWRFVSRDTNIELERSGAEAWQLRHGRIVWGLAGFIDRQAAIDAVERRRDAR
jgi:ketosteroid isomerase-like protein